MKDSLVSSADAAIPLVIATASTWVHLDLSLCQLNWLKAQQREFQAHRFYLLPDASGHLVKVVFCVETLEDLRGFGNLALTLPEACYEIISELPDAALEQAALYWALGAYQFTRYKKAHRAPAQLVFTNAHSSVFALLAGIETVRDLINTPPNEMMPEQLSVAAQQLVDAYQGSLQEIVGEDLLTQGFPAIYTVGKGSIHPPRLLDLRFGQEGFKLTLVGKGVCFDTGGLNMKSGQHMALMKKDMGGAAHALGLAQMILAAKLPIALRVLIPAVENAVSGSAYRPSDVITMRNGMTVEVTDTDAEGRLVLADALTYACEESMDLLIDFATLTGAARVAVGTEISALFSNREEMADVLKQKSFACHDPIWPQPLYAPYAALLSSSIADFSNATASSYAGAITAALFLEKFIRPEYAWLHFDLMAWNLRARPGHPEGGEAMALRTLFHYLA